MLNAFHVRRSKEVECQKVSADSALPLARPAGTRRQGEKLAYANFVIDLSTPARKFNFLPRAMFDTAAIQRGPNLASILFSRFRPTHSNVLRIANERYLLARERCPTRSFNQWFGGYSRIALTTLHRKKKATPLSDRLRNFTT